MIILGSFSIPINFLPILRAVIPVMVCSLTIRLPYTLL
jgi:hypothetical protein